LGARSGSPSSRVASTGSITWRPHVARCGASSLVRGLRSWQAAQGRCRRRHGLPRSGSTVARVVPLGAMLRHGLPPPHETLGLLPRGARLTRTCHGIRWRSGTTCDCGRRANHGRCGAESGDCGRRTFIPVSVPPVQSGAHGKLQALRCLGGRTSFARISRPTCTGGS
jgi:hypothetical protein